MNVAIFGGFGKRMLADGWTKETALALLGGGEFDLTGVTHGEGARLTAVAIFGGVDVIIDEGAKVTMSGFSLFGGREVTVPAGDGPAVKIRAVAVFGSVKVRPPAPSNMA